VTAMTSVAARLGQAATLVMAVTSVALSVFWIVRA